MRSTEQFMEDTRKIAALMLRCEAAERERDALWSGIRAFVAARVWQTSDRAWQSMETGIARFTSREEAEEAAYRHVLGRDVYETIVRKGLPIAPAAGGEASGGERAGESRDQKDD